MQVFDFKFELGQKVVDDVNGFTGIIQGRCQYAHSVNTYAVQPTNLDDKGLPNEWQWLEGDRLKLVTD